MSLILWLVDRLEMDADLFLHEVVIKDHRGCDEGFPQVSSGIRFGFGFSGLGLRVTPKGSAAYHETQICAHGSPFVCASVLVMGG